MRAWGGGGGFLKKVSTALRCATGRGRFCLGLFFFFSFLWHGWSYPPYRRHSRNKDRAGRDAAIGQCKLISSVGMQEKRKKKESRLHSGVQVEASNFAAGGHVIVLHPIRKAGGRGPA